MTNAEQAQKVAASLDLLRRQLDELTKTTWGVNLSRVRNARDYLVDAEVQLNEIIGSARARKARIAREVGMTGYEQELA